MALALYIWSLAFFGCCMFIAAEPTDEYQIDYMSKDERESLKEEARDMFYHAYNAYMDNAYPADELMPLSCKGRYRGTEANRGDIDFTLGNFSLTLVDTLDTLVVLGDFEEFENAVKMVIRDVSFDTDVIVSLFETNIRMLGGLLSGHILAEYLQQRADLMSWYRGELLDLAKDLGYRFLPAFNTTTGIPYGKINLKHGMKGVSMELSRETCTACAGSMILELAALSRLTGEPIFEEKAQKAMDVLWKMRHRGTDLMGSVLNVHSGDWVRRDSGVGAGIDSYYEYCLKAYILLGDEKYLGRFNKHYQAVMKYVSQGPMLLDVHMHRPNTNSKNFMDALLAFWPGLQVLKGDIKPAVETHEMLYQVMQRHNFIPEAFTTDFQVHWAHHPLRPEFLESTYFLYKATGDHYYLNVGRKVLRSLQTYTKVPCGYAAVSDVRTNKHDDTMDSFFLSETLKYLFLLFAEPDDLMLNLDEFIFTTEGHLLPLTLSSARINISTVIDRDLIHVDAMDRTCPNSLHLFPATVRMPLRNMVEDICPSRSLTRRLSASQFQASNADHMKILSEMGITIHTLANGRIQLLHTFSNAKSPRHAEEGIIFMQEMIEISKGQAKKQVTFKIPDSNPPKEVILLAGPAQFGLILKDSKKVTGKVALADPITACSELQNPDVVKGKIAVILRGGCIFVEKARRVQKAGAIAAIVIDNVPGTSVNTSPMFAMTGDPNNEADIKIPVVFLFHVEGEELLSACKTYKNSLVVSIGVYVHEDIVQLNAPSDISMFERLKGSLKEFLKRQIMPQYPPTKEPILESQIESKVKSTVYLDNLRCVIEKESDELSISAALPFPANSTTIENAEPLVYKTDFETCWLALRQLLLSEIYSKINSKSTLRLKYSHLKSLYQSIVVLRRIEITEPMKKVIENQANHRIFWFLSELSEVKLDPALLSINEFVEMKTIKLRLISHLIHLADSGSVDPKPFDDIDIAIIALTVQKNEIISKFIRHSFINKSWPKTLNFEEFILSEVESSVKEISRSTENGAFLVLEDVLTNNIEDWTVLKDLRRKIKIQVHHAIQDRMQEMFRRIEKNDRPKDFADTRREIPEEFKLPSLEEGSAKKADDGSRHKNNSRHIDDEF